MPTRRILLRTATTFALALAAAGGLHAAPQAPAYQAMMDALTRAHAAVVGVQVVAAEGAQSAASLGRERMGSGVVIGPDGLILTIGYLLLEAEAIQVVTQDDKALPARAVAYDLATGFGLLRPLVPLRGVTPVPLGSAAQASTGDSVMVSVGGEEADVTMARLVSKRAFSGYWEYHIESALFTSPPVRNHSGAPLFNERGELLGIGSLFVGDVLGDNRRVPGNLFVPVDLLKPILPELERTGSSAASRRPWLGVTSTEQGGRVQIVRVNADSPAQSAGLATGDLVLAVDGEKVSTLEAFYKRIWAHPNPDDEIRLTVLQGAEVKQITIKAIDRMQTLRKPAGI